ncbi:hypothetical protein ACH5RR_036290 [Cinchona calisaya]|uniref:Reverse transcriptase n=1 Tax=Cinchona calisaya TaxID=153742 RepID=A0ABD2Y484_9GENT
MKLDMMKVFDRVSWRFLEAALLYLGFSSLFVRPVMNNLKAEVLSSRLKYLANSKEILPFFLPRGYLNAPHLVYVDDFAVFTPGDKVSLCQLLSFLETYQSRTGQRINSSESSLIFCKNVVIDLSTQ